MRRFKLPLLSRLAVQSPSKGFSAVELLLACTIFPIIVIGIATSYNAVHRSYTVARQLNEIYAVLSACPEVDRALEFNSLSSTTNCYPNNTFYVEDVTSGKTINYSPALTVDSTSSLAGTDPLQPIPDSKVVHIEVDYLPPLAGTTPLELRMLITRNGIGQQ